MTRRSPGRPPATSPETIALEAFRLFAERGYEATTLRDIAEAAGISRSTLFGYFPAKGDILWIDHAAGTEELRELLLATRPGTSLADGALAAWAELWKRRADARTFSRPMLEILAAASPASTSIWEKYELYARMHAEYVAARLGGSPDDLGNRAIGGMLWAAAWSAWGQWAVSGDASPEPYLREALALFSEALAAPSTGMPRREP